jgi:predicted RNA-binding Zn-ribbon protein involved in translation (DUF1610 family)
MRTFKCYDCGHTWQLPHGEGGRGIDLTCPNCGSHNIHRADRERDRRATEAESVLPGRGQGRRERRRAA